MNDDIYRRWSYVLPSDCKLLLSSLPISLYKFKRISALSRLARRFSQENNRMRQSFRFKKKLISALGRSLQNNAYDSLTDVSDVLK